jgi:hypothetical protein
VRNIANIDKGFFPFSQYFKTRHVLSEAICFCVQLTPLVTFGFPGFLFKNGFAVTKYRTEVCKTSQGTNCHKSGSTL